jgi:hypothetical protein
MREFLLRVGGPVAGFSVAAGLQVSGIESPVLAIVLFCVAGLWAAIAFVTWEPVKRRLIYVIRGREDWAMPPPKDRTGGGVHRVGVDPRFDPHTIITILAGADLSGLSEPESFMVITLNVRNVSGFPASITGVKGRIRCAGAECNLPATVEREPRSLGPSDRLTPCVVRQPLSDGMMNQIALAGDLLRISLSDLQWVGTVALPQGSAPLERCYIHEEFLVRGPFREKKEGSTLFRLTTTFLSSEHFDSDGVPKQRN